MTTLEEPAAAAPEAPPHTGSPATRRLGVAAGIGVALLLFFGLVISGPEVNMGESVRLFYLHVPTIMTAYLGFLITLIGSAIYLRTQSVFWDLLAGASAELGVLFCTFALATGALWGKPTWGVYWTWEPRITATVVLYVTYIGYLAVRRLELPPDVRSRRAAILGIVSFANVIVVHYSVQWWRGLHQGRTLGLDPQIAGMQYFAFVVGLVAMLLVFSWLLVHRFRVAFLQRQIEELSVDRALAERRAETEKGGRF
ncbi:MAG: cytochrome c biogenesis protein CcsA [Actinomycetota bacterium]